MDDLKIDTKVNITKLKDGGIIIGNRKLKKIRVNSKDNLPYQCYMGICFAIKNDTVVEFYSYCDVGGKFIGTASFLVINYDDISRMNNYSQFNTKEIEKTHSLDAYINFIFTFIRMDFVLYIIDN
jgi:hypothetical protein